MSISRVLKGKELDGFFSEKHAGKTTLGKKIFSNVVQSGGFPLWVDYSEITTKDIANHGDFFKRLINDTFENCSLEMTDHLDRVLIIDSVSQFNMKKDSLEEFIEKSKTVFSSVLVLADESYRVQELISINSELMEEQYQLLPFSSMQKIELIKNWIYCGGETIAQDELDFQVRNNLQILRQATGNSLIPSFPMYLLILLRNVHAQTSNSGIPSSSAGLISRMVNWAIDRITIKGFDSDSLDFFLMNLAKNIFDYKKEDRAFLSNDFDQFCKNHALKYTLPVDSNSFLDNFIIHDFLGRTNDLISFKHDYLFYYFLGKSLARDAGRDISIMAVLTDMIEKLYRDDYSNIIVYAAYFYEGPEVFEKIMSEAKKILENQTIAQLKDDVKKFPEIFAEDKMKLILQQHEQHQANLAKVADASSGFDLESKKAIDTNNDISRSFKFIEVLGQVIKNKTGVLEGGFKEKAVFEVLGVSGRLVGTILTYVHDHSDKAVIQISDKIKKDNPKLELDDIQKQSRKFLMHILGVFVSSIVEKVSFHAGSAIMRAIFASLASKSENNFYHLCLLQVSLDYEKTPPLSQMENLIKEVDKYFFTKQVLRLIAYRYFLTTKVDYKKRQQICTLLNIDINQVNTAQVNKLLKG